MLGFTTQFAEKILESKLERTKMPTKYIAGFRTRKGRELALERHRKTIVAVWAECIDAQLHHNLSFDFYPSKRSRNSNLTANAPRLASGRDAWYLNFKDSAKFESFLEWYQGQ